MRQNQRGFSLIELIVVIAIVGIVSLAIVGFMLTGTTSYASTSAEATMQQEAQIAMNQIQDLVIDTTKAVTYSYQDTPGGTETLILKDDAAAASAVAKKLCLYNKDNAYEITWKDDKKLYYAEYAVSAGVKTGTATEYLLSDYVSRFQVDLTNLKDKRVVWINLDFEKQGRTYNSSNNITIRNKVIVNSTDAYEDPSIPSGVPTDINLAENALYLCPNEAYMMLPPVVTGTGHPSQEVIWKFDTTEKPTDTSGTTLDETTGALQIGQKETGNGTNGTFRIVVAAKADPTVSKTVTVYIKRVNLINITDTIVWRAGETGTLSVAVTAQNTDETGVTWKIMPGEDTKYFTQAAGNPASISIAADAPVGAKIVVRATSVHSVTHNYPDDTNHIYGEKTIEVAEAKPEFNLYIGNEINFNTMFDNDDGQGTYVRYVRVQKYHSDQDEPWTDLVSTDTRWQNLTTELDNYWDGGSRGTWHYESDGIYRIDGNNGTNMKFTPPELLDMDNQYLFTYYQKKTYPNGSTITSKKVQVGMPKLTIRYSGKNIAADAKKIEQIFYVYDKNEASKTWLYRNMDEMGNYRYQLYQQTPVIAVDKFPNQSFSFKAEKKDGDSYTSYSGWPKLTQATSKPSLELYEMNSVIQDGVYRFSPKLTYYGKTYDRTYNYMEFEIQHGNIMIDGLECFLPYPSHPDFYAPNAEEGKEVDDYIQRTLLYDNGGTGKYNPGTKQVYVRLKRQSDGSYKMFLYRTLLPNKKAKDPIGYYWCSADGTEWTKIQEANY